jgi:hypothetical protein
VLKESREKSHPAAPLDDLHARTRAREGEFRARVRDGAAPETIRPRYGENRGAQGESREIAGVLGNSARFWGIPGRHEGAGVKLDMSLQPARIVRAMRFEGLSVSRLACQAAQAVFIG